MNKVEKENKQRNFSKKRANKQRNEQRNKERNCSRLFSLYFICQPTRSAKITSFTTFLAQ